VVGMSGGVVGVSGGGAARGFARGGGVGARGFARGGGVGAAKGFFTLVRLGKRIRRGVLRTT
jgi:hypothetical protein